MSDVDLILIVVATLVGSFIKSVTGMGYPLIAIPFLSLFIDVETAVVVVAIPNTVTNLLLNVDAREARSETRDLVPLALTSAVGAVVGTLLLVRAPEEPLLIGLSVTVFAFIFQVLRRPSLHLSPATTKRWAPVTGAVAGFSQGAVGVSGPIVAMWFHGYRLSKNAYVVSVTTIFLLSGAGQLVVLIVSDKFDRSRLIGAALATVAALSMIPIGTRMRDRLAGETFERLVLGLLAFSGLSLLLRSLS